MSDKETPSPSPSVVRSEHQILRWVIPTNDGKGLRLTAETESRIVTLSFGGVTINFDLAFATAFQQAFYEAITIATPLNTD